MGVVDNLLFRAGKGRVGTQLQLYGVDRSCESNIRAALRARKDANMRPWCRRPAFDGTELFDRFFGLRVVNS